MPFTLSHAGFLLPFKKKIKSHIFLALMIGSMTPDFGYYIANFKMASFAHTTLGAIFAGLPIGILLYLICVFFFKYCVSIIPVPHSPFLKSWEVYRQSVKVTIPIIISILIGAFLHNLVDSFTHKSGMAVSLFPFLQGKLSLGGIELDIYNLLQHLGSLLGVISIAIYYLYSFLEFCKKEKLKLWQDWKNWLILIALTSITCLISAGFYIKIIINYHTRAAFDSFIFKFLTTWIPFFLITFLITAVVVTVLSKRKKLPKSGF